MRQICSWLLTLALVLGLCACGQNAEAAWQEQYDLGVRYLSEGNYEEAIIAFAAAIEIDPKRAEAYIGLADVYIATEDYDQARAVLEDALEQVDDPAAIREKLEEVESLIQQAGSPPEDGGPDQPDAPEQPEGPGAGDEEPPEGEEEEPQPPEEPETPPEEEPAQLPETYTAYQYAVDLVDSATIWDVYKSMEGSPDYDLEELTIGVYEGAAQYLAYMTREDLPGYQNFSVSSQVIQGTPGEWGNYSTQQLLTVSDRFPVSRVTGRYSPTGMPISPAFGENLTYDDIIRICGERGYSYTTRTDGLAYETYVEIQVENGRTVAFAWDGFGVEEISGVPVSFVIW